MECMKEGEREEKELSQRMQRRGELESEAKEGRREMIGKGGGGGGRTTCRWKMIEIRKDEGGVERTRNN